MAHEADVTPTAVYTYFADMADLRHRLGDRFLGTLNLELLAAPAGATAALREFLRHVLDVFGRAPGQVQILASQRILGPHALGLNEALLTFFIDRVGHPPPAAAAATDLVTEWVHGTLLLSTSNVPLTGDVSLVGYPRTAEMLTGTGTGTGTRAGAGPGDCPEDEAGAVTSLDLVVRAVTRGED